MSLPKGNALTSGRKHTSAPRGRRSPHVAVGHALREPVRWIGGRPAETGGEVLDRRTAQRPIGQHHEMAGMRLVGRAPAVGRLPR